MLAKGIRAPERIYAIVLWLVSLVFAGFIVGLGNLVIGDLPMVDEQVVAPPARSPAAIAIDRDIAAIGVQRGGIDDRLEIARLQRDQAQRASQTGTETFRAWIAARTATTDPAQDPEVLSRTRQLEQLKANERTINTAIGTLEGEALAFNQRIDALQARQEQLQADALPAQERARFQQELRVFGMRLAITLPLLAIAAWMVVKQRRSDYWPLMRGFVLAAVFVFFVELVPYLPSYGGYIRYVVGIALTIAAAVYVTRNMRDYLARRREIEAQADAERRQHLSRDEAYKKMAAKVCPGCDRPVATTGEAEANFCVHCGLTLFDRCCACDTRKMAFFRHCMSCGTPAEEGGGRDHRPHDPAPPLDRPPLPAS